MKRDAVKAKLSDIIVLVSEEQKKQPSKWFPLLILQDLHGTIEDSDDMKLLSDINGIVYSMIAYVDYRSLVFKVVTDFCFGIEQLIALHHAQSIVIQIKPSGMILQMKQLISEWISKFSDNGGIPEETRHKYSIEFVKLYNRSPAYWDEIFPEHVKRILSKGSDTELSTNS
ncbi:MAG: hypothetical protein ACYDCO_10740 [Armatimonadota bacterium]